MLCKVDFIAFYISSKIIFDLNVIIYIVIFERGIL